VHRRLDAAQPAAHVHRTRAMLQEIDAGVVRIVGAENTARFKRLVRLPDVADFHGRDQHAFGVTQADAIAFLDARGELMRHIERDRDRPNEPRWQAHLREHALVGGARQESIEGGEGAVQQQLDVA
jgi:hypothetical protein